LLDDQLCCYDTIHQTSVTDGETDEQTRTTAYTALCIRVLRYKKIKSFHHWFCELCWYNAMKMIHKLDA